MKSTFLIALSLCAALVSGCANMASHTRTISATQLQSKLDEKMALPISALKAVGATLQSPKVSFDAANERIVMNFDVSFQNALVGNLSGGAAQISGKLKFDEKTNAVLLDQGKIDSFKIGGNLGIVSELVNLAVRNLSGDILKDIPLYTLKPEDLSVAGIQFKPKNFKVTGAGLEVQLAP